MSLFAWSTEEVLEPPARVVVNFKRENRALLARRTRVLWPYDLYCTDERDLCLEVALLGPQLETADDTQVEKLAALLKASAKLLPVRRLKLKGVFLRRVWANKRPQFVAEFAQDEALQAWVNNLCFNVHELKFPGVPRTETKKRRECLLPHRLHAHVATPWGRNQPDIVRLAEEREFTIVSVEVKGAGSARVLPHLS